MRWKGKAKLQSYSEGGEIGRFSAGCEELQANPCPTENVRLMGFADIFSGAAMTIRDLLSLTLSSAAEERGFDFGLP